MAEPLVTAPLAPPAASPAAVARAMIRALQPAEADVALPGWLLEAQRPLVRRVLAALDRHGGALLAAPVGAGKTWMALAAAAVHRPEALTPVLAPAPLVAHWRRVARTLGVPVHVLSHAHASAGRLPDGDGLAILDESQHLRNPGIRRHAHVARWLVGRETLLLSATPVVNRLADLAAQLRLAVRDDALAANGISSLSRMLAEGRAHPALGELVVAPARPAVGDEARRTVSADVDGALLARIDDLRLSDARPIRALIRRVLWRAAASSPAALAETAGRYERLLRQGADASAAGRRVDVATLRRFAGDELDQLVMWELVADRGAVTLELGDLPLVETLRRAALTASRSDDHRLRALRTLLEDGRPTVIFTTRRATLHYLRDRLGDARLAWCAGHAAGIGPLRASRASVLDWFRASAPDAPRHALAPRHLVTTDVAAEGLDLGHAVRVVHYDLPWTAARLEQREGRVRRGAPRPREVVTLAVPASVERRLALVSRIARKAALPATVDLAPGASGLWTWRASLAPLGEGEALEGSAFVPSSHEGVLAVFTIGEARRAAASIVWLAREEQSEDARFITARLQEALAGDGAVLSSDVRRAALARLAPLLRDRLRLGQRAVWQPLAGREGVARLLARLWELARRAARDRKGEELARLQRAIRFVGGGHTAGEAMLVAELADAEPRTLARALAALPAPGDDRLPACRLAGLLVFGALADAPPAATFGRHDALPHHPLRPRRDVDRLDPSHPEQLPPHPRRARHPRADR